MGFTLRKAQELSGSCSLSVQANALPTWQETAVLLNLCRTAQHPLQQVIQPVVDRFSAPGPGQPKHRLMALYHPARSPAPMNRVVRAQGQMGEPNTACCPPPIVPPASVPPHPTSLACCSGAFAPPPKHTGRTTTEGNIRAGRGEKWGREVKQDREASGGVDPSVMLHAGSYHLFFKLPCPLCSQRETCWHRTQKTHC